MQLETATNTRTLAFWCPVTFHGHLISSQSPLKHTRSLDYFAGLCVLVAVYQQRKCSTYHFSNLNLCTVHRFGVHHFLKKIKTIQRCATKFILNSYVSDYRTRLLKLHILPLLILHEVIVMFFFVCVSNPSNKHPELLHYHRLCLFQWQQH